MNNILAFKKIKTYIICFYHIKIGIFKLLINSYLYTYKIKKIFIASLCKIRQ